jgi:predicted transcriptional regulator
MRIGNKELEILTFIAQSDGATVRDVAEHFEEKSGLGRTTVLKTMDRLRAKGFLEREEVAGLFRYRSLIAPRDIQQELTQQFVSDTLNGSIAPFVAYLRAGADVSDQDLAELRALVEKLEEGQR